VDTARRGNSINVGGVTIACISVMYLAFVPHFHFYNHFHYLQSRAILLADGGYVSYMAICGVLETLKVITHLVVSTALSV